MKRFPALVALRSILLLSASAAVQQAVENSCQGVEKVFDGAKAETHVCGGRGWRAVLDKVSHVCGPLQHPPPAP
ncbi:MAG: hypothetical protein DMG28_14535 [Acidobacteria bacterium]|nr:MAG: hypothetical protein DMG28_14535 [Acidobacteriota bacterium]